MKIEELTQEQIEKAKSLATDEERLAYLKECGVELDDDMLTEVAGGGPAKPRSHTKTEKAYCQSGPNFRKPHKWAYTGGSKKGFLGFGELKEVKCIYCGFKKWSSV